MDHDDMRGQRTVVREAGGDVKLCPELDQINGFCKALQIIVIAGFGPGKKCSPATYRHADKRSPTCEVLA